MARDHSQQSAKSASRESQAQAVPLAEERLRVSKRTREAGGVVIDKTVQTREEVVSEPVLVDEARVRRVRIDRMVDQPPEVREEDGELVVPLLEEVLVVEKRLMLREELRIRTSRTETPQREVYTLRTEQADVRREVGSEEERR